jgi:hypothetical protein
MWETFWPDVLVAVVGAVLTVAIAFGTFLIQQRMAERQLLTNLVSDLNHRRVLREIAPREMPGARGFEDYDWTSQSVVEIRDQIRSTREHLPRNSRAQRLLSAMHSACNRHLHNSSRNLHYNQFHLVDLRNNLEIGVAEISRQVRKVKALRPGSAAY